MRTRPVCSANAQLPCTERPRLCADGKRCAVWRCVLAPEAASRGAAAPSDAALLRALHALRASPSRWAVILSRGGHFAAAVFELLPERLAKPGQGAAAWEAVAHRSVHRYVVRAGQGGKQSSKDAGGKYARSAGSRLRRHNEVGAAQC